jgi:hypothetical protein
MILALRQLKCIALINGYAIRTVLLFWYGICNGFGDSIEEALKDLDNNLNK